MNKASNKIDKYERYNEISWHLLEDERPSDYLNQLALQGGLTEYPFSMLMKLKEAKQEPKHHPEGNVWEHTMLVVDEAARVRAKTRDPGVFMWAALLHDIGKPDTTKMRRGRLTSYDHDKVGEALASTFLEELGLEKDFVRTVSGLVRYHMHILYVLKELPYADLEGLLFNVDIDELALLCLCDRLGRGRVDRDAEYQHYEAFRTILLQERERLMLPS